MWCLVGGLSLTGGELLVACQMAMLAVGWGLQRAAWLPALAEIR